MNKPLLLLLKEYIDRKIYEETMSERIDEDGYSPIVKLEAEKVWEKIMKIKDE